MQSSNSEMSTRILILHFDEISKVVYCFHRRMLELLRFEVSEELKPTPGQFLAYDEDKAEISNEILKIESARIEEPLKEDCVIMGDGTFKISSWIAFSTNPNHRSYDRSVAFSDWYGFVRCDGYEEVLKNGNGFRCFIALNDLQYKENGTELFKVQHVKGKIFRGHLNGFLRKAEQFEENCLWLQPSTSSPSEGSTTKSVGVSSSRSKPRDSNSGGYNDSLTVIFKKSEDFLIGWLWRAKAAALIPWERFRWVDLGEPYKCRVERIKKAFEVEYIVKEIGYCPPEDVPINFQDVDGIIQAEVLVNLSSFPSSNGKPIIYADFFGMVTTSEMIKHPTLGETSWQNAFQNFIEDEKSRQAKALCRLTRQRVPRGFGNAESISDVASDNVLRFIWQITEVLEEYENSD